MKLHILLSQITLMSNLAFGQTLPVGIPDPTWQLLFSDEFNDGAINTSLWHVADEFDHFAANNIVHIDDNVIESGGNLVLTFKKQNYDCLAAPPYNGLPGDIYFCKRQNLTGLIYNHTGGYVWTKAAYNFKYGYIEARVKLDYAHGLFPAFWTFLGDDIATYTNGSEIDIFEMRMGTDPANIMTCNIHYTYPAADPLDGFADPYIGNYDDVWRTFAVEWGPDFIHWYVDGTWVRTYGPPYNGGYHQIHDPVKVLFDLGIEGLPGQENAPDASTPALVNMYVDYLRVYQLDHDCANAFSTCSFNYSTYPKTVKESITIGGCAGSVYSVPAGDSQYLHASDFIQINGDFTVPVGAELLLDVGSCY